MQGADVIFEMLDHVEADGQVEGVVVEGHVHDRAGDHLARAAGARKLDARLGQLDAGDGAVAGKIDHVAPTAATSVEDLRMRRQSEAPDRALQHCAAPLVPPVAVLGAVCLQLVLQLHVKASFTNGRRRAARPP